MLRRPSPSCCHSRQCSAVAPLLRAAILGYSVAILTTTLFCHSLATLRNDQRCCAVAVHAVQSSSLARPSRSVPWQSDVALFFPPLLPFRSMNCRSIAMGCSALVAVAVRLPAWIRSSIAVLRHAFLMHCKSELCFYDTLPRPSMLFILCCCTSCHI